MLTFLFEQYGYYPKDFQENFFCIDNWLFRLIETEESDEYISQVDEYAQNIRKNFFDKGPYIIRTRSGKISSFYDNKKYVLVSIQKGKLSLKDLNKFHYIFKEEGKSVNLKDLLTTWERRHEDIEREALYALRIDSVYYKNNLEISMFSLGLAQNALQYLSELILDYGEIVEEVSIVHKRLNNLDSFDFFNPFNFVVDHPLRDLVELYKSNFLHFDDLVSLLDYYKMESKLASLFMSRILYPAKIFDCLEEKVIKKEQNFKINYNIENEMQKIKKIYKYLKDKYNIRPINWLDY